jgi:hypothetical protein
LIDNWRWWLLVVLSSSILLFGCEDSNFYISQDQTLSYASFLFNCTTVSDVNVSDSWGVCGSKENVLTSLLDVDNWSVTCCGLNPAYCYEDVDADFVGVCDPVTNWTLVAGQCCDFTSGFCYVLSDVTVGCRLNYTLVVASVFQNDSLWDGWCCRSGGLL